MNMSALQRIMLSAMVICCASSARGVQFGWQKLNDGGIEYLVQVEPTLLESFHEQGFISDIPPGLRDVRRIRITVGEDKLPNQNNLQGPQALPPPPPTPSDKSAASNPTAGASAARDPGATGSGAEYSNSGSPQDQSVDSNRIASHETAGDNAATPANASPEHSLFPLPFLRSGMGRSAAPKNGEGDANSVANPQLGPDDGPPDGRTVGTHSLKIVDAQKPDITNSSTAVSSGNGDPLPTATSKPWLPLMAALLALFASLAANVYLAWIHQAVRAKYRALIQRLPLGGAAT
jgi:hypothetical protein